MESSRSVAEARPELLVNEAVAAIVVARNSLRVFIDAHLSSVNGGTGGRVVMVSPFMRQSPPGRIFVDDQAS
jgi:hypothetical protein